MAFLASIRAEVIFDGDGQQVQSASYFAAHDVEARLLASGPTAKPAVRALNLMGRIIAQTLGVQLMNSSLLQSRMKRLFTEGFTAMDIAEPLLSFDADKPAADVRRFISDNGLDVVGVRSDGVVIGYVQLDELADGSCRDCLHNFDESTVVHQTSSYRDVIDCLSRSQYCFVSVLGGVDAVIMRPDIQKPSVRMWLFGMITILEMFISRTLEATYPDSSWRAELSANRLGKAEALRQERKRRNQQVRLLDCLHLSDKAQILMKDPTFRNEAGFESRRAAEKGIRDFESLRNSLAHAHDIVTYDWDMIVEVSQRMDKIMTRF
ncbi:MAG: hypothetical protein ACYSR4_04535 [Planctomycetota bacterium]|jgi:hypothetical protein